MKTKKTKKPSLKCKTQVKAGNVVFVVEDLQIAKAESIVTQDLQDW